MKRSEYLRRILEILQRAQGALQQNDLKGLHKLQEAWVAYRLHEVEPTDRHNFYEWVLQQLALPSEQRDTELLTLALSSEIQGLPQDIQRAVRREQRTSILA